MKSCDYCGTENEQSSKLCAGCGTQLANHEELPDSRRPHRAPWFALPRDLNAASGTIILLVYLIANVFCVVCTGLVAYLIATHRGSIKSDQTFKVLGEMAPILEVLCPIFGGIGTLLASVVLVPSWLKNRSPNGAAWVWGSRKALIGGLAIGLVLGALAVCMTRATKHNVNHRNLDALARMALTPGWMQVIAIGVAVLVGPTTEEILFRGVLFGAYRKTMGPAGAAALTTFLFILLHLPKVIHHVPALLGLCAVAVGALWCRLRYAAVGPAVAVHIGYNTLIALVVLLMTRPGPHA